jgi:hypothetical protein
MLILEKGGLSAIAFGIWPGIISHPFSLIVTSWTGDVYVDIDTEKLPRLKGCKLSVSMPEFPASAPARTPTESVAARRDEPAMTRPEAPISTPAQIPTDPVEVRRPVQSASDGNDEGQSQVAVSPNTKPQSIEVRRAEIVGSDG